MVLSGNSIARKNMRDLLEKLAPLGLVNGVQDYLLADRRGSILARKPSSFWKDETAGACARDMAQVVEVLTLLSPDNGQERLFDFRFEGALLIVWSLGSACLIALCSGDANLSITRMTANVIKEELRKDRRFRRYFAAPVGAESSLLTEQELGSDLHKYVAALRKK